MFNNSTGRYFAFFAIYLLAIFSRFLHPDDLYLSYFTDDFFYYYKVAENLNRLGISSFDGVHLTNGYHPLWMVTIAGIYKLTGAGLPLFVATALVFCLLVTVTYVLYERISANLFGESSITWAGSLLSAIFIGALARTGMEISLAAFFLALFFYRNLIRPPEEQSATELGITGFIASLAFLARIDAIIPVFIYFSLLFFESESKVSFLRKLMMVSLGAILIPAYMALNWVEFKTLLPISGAAKQLKTSYGISLTPLLRMADFSFINIIFTWPTIILGLYAAKSLKSAPLKTNSKIVIASILLHSVVFYSILCIKSDWPSWTWYLYPIPPIACVSLPFLKKYTPQFGRTSMPMLLAFYSIVAITGIIKKNPGALPIYQTAKELAQFSESHPGTYAMGDRAGTPAYLLKSPLIQLEGLVGDRQLLEDIKASTNLNTVLKKLNINYYVTSSFVQKTNCYHSIEPAQAGPASPVMVGIFCNSPIARLTAGGHETLIFDITKQP